MVRTTPEKEKWREHWDSRVQDKETNNWFDDFSPLTSGPTYATINNEKHTKYKWKKNNNYKWLQNTPYDKFYKHWKTQNLTKNSHTEILFKYFSRQIPLMWPTITPVNTS
jgi:hypothetical protein